MTYELLPSGNPFEAVLDRLEERSRARQEVGARTSAPLRHAKKAIFALQRRGDADGAREELAAARKDLGALQEEYAAVDHGIHGQWRVAVEEFLEAVFFLQFCEGRPLDMEDADLCRYDHDGEGRTLRVEDEEVLGALSDFTGEAYRQMQLWISEERYAEAIRAHQAIADATELLNQNTSGGNLRNKVDQANRNLHQADARITDMKIRGLL
jgi:predicted translin family RNA/ssDNA-binding protein